MEGLWAAKNIADKSVPTGPFSLVAALSVVAVRCVAVALTFEHCRVRNQCHFRFSLTATNRALEFTLAVSEHKLKTQLYSHLHLDNHYEAILMQIRNFFSRSAGANCRRHLGAGCRRSGGLLSTYRRPDQAGIRCLHRQDRCADQIHNRQGSPAAGASAGRRRAHSGRYADHRGLPETSGRPSSKACSGRCNLP